LPLATRDTAVFFSRVLSIRLIPWLALSLSLLAPAQAQLPHLPFSLDDPDGHWRLAPGRHTLPDGLEFVALMAPRVGPPRLLIFKTPATPALPDPLVAFAQRLRTLVLVEPTANVRSAPATKIGYPGHLVSLEAPRAQGSTACEIFTFAAGEDYWGLLQITPTDARAESPYSVLKKAKLVPAGAVALTPFRVQENPLNSFPVGLRVTRQTAEDRIAQIFVAEVPEGSTAEATGLKVGDEIVRIDGRAVTAFAGGLSRRSELGKILIERKPGSTVEFAVLSTGEREPRTVTLVAVGNNGLTRRW